MSVPDTAICQQYVWKSEAMRACALAIVQAGCRLNAEGVREVSAGDVPDSAVPADSPGLAGTVCHALVAAHIFYPVWIVRPTETTPGQCKRAKSKRASRKDAFCNVYELVSLGVAEAFLRVNRAAIPSAQAELGIAEAPRRERADGRW